MARKRKTRRRGSGSVQWRGGRCYVRIGHSDPVTGTRVEKVERVLIFDTDPITGTRVEVTDRQRVEKAAEERLTQLRYERQETGGKSVQHASKTFLDLAALFERHHLIEAEYRQQRNGKLVKVAGLRPATLANTRSLLAILKRELGAIELREITPNYLKAFRLRRIKAPASCRRCIAKPAHAKEHKADEQPKLRSMTAVHRELMLLNQMLGMATAEGWIRSNPFASFPRGKSLIRIKDFEAPRERVMTPEEETRILAACGSGIEGRRCRLAIIALVDTGMRKGELFSLQWSDIDLENNRIHIRAINNKTLKSRVVATSSRLREELVAWRELYDAGNGAPILGSTGNIKRYFADAKSKAKPPVPDLHFHDLRHTAATRMEAAGMKESAVAKILGHARIQQTRTYINPDEDSIVTAALTAINAANAANAQATTAAATTAAATTAESIN